MTRRVVDTFSEPFTEACALLPPSVSPHRRWRTRRPKTFGAAAIATGWFCAESSDRTQTVKKESFLAPSAAVAVPGTGQTARFLSETVRRRHEPGHRWAPC